MNRRILTAVTLPSLSAAVGGTFAAPSYAASHIAPVNKPPPVSSLVTFVSTSVAFQSISPTNCSSLWTWNGSAGQSGAFGKLATLPCVGMAAGTSPSEAALPNGETVVAFRGSNGDLWTWVGYPGNLGTGVDHDLGMMPGTSPSITLLSGDEEVAVAFQANTGALWTWDGTPTSLGFGASTGVGMASGTSPSAAALTSGPTAVAVQGSNGDLWTWVGDPGTNFGFGVSTGLGMAGLTSPSITTLASGET